MKNLKKNILAAFLLVNAIILSVTSCSLLNETQSGGINITLPSISTGTRGNFHTKEETRSFTIKIINNSNGILKTVIEDKILTEENSSVVSKNYELEAGTYTVEISACDKDGAVIADGSSTVEVKEGEVTNATVTLTLKEIEEAKVAANISFKFSIAGTTYNSLAEAKAAYSSIILDSALTAAHYAGETITLNSPEPESLAAGSVITKFAGWYSGENIDTAEKIENTSSFIINAENITLWAKWDKVYVAITTIDELVENINASNTETDVYILQNDLTVENAINWTRFGALNGILDGNGYTITFAGGTCPEPLFDGMNSTAIIKNLKIVGDFKNTTINAGQFGAFTLNNDYGGLIVGCSFSGSVYNNYCSGVSSFVFGGDKYGNNCGNFVGCIATVSLGDGQTEIAKLTEKTGENTQVISVVYDTDETSADELNSNIDEWNSTAEEGKKCYWKFVEEDGKLTMVPNPTAE